MLDKKEFVQIKKNLAQSEQKREDMIQLSREVIQSSKKIIYALHRDDLKGAQSGLKDIEKKRKGLKFDKDIDTNMPHVAVQEYVEAITYLEFVQKKKLSGPSKLKVSVEDYLLGLCDLTGELGRRAVNQAIAQNYKEVVRVKECVTEIYGAFLDFDLRNGELRKKSDTIKWNLKKIEDVVFDLSVKGKI